MKEVKNNRTKNTTKDLTPTEQVEYLVDVSKRELKDEATEAMVKKIKMKLIERKSAAKVLANIEREIDLMKIQLVQELESL